jgi:hypothetical protein
MAISDPVKSFLGIDKAWTVLNAVNLLPWLLDYNWTRTVGWSSIMSRNWLIMIMLNCFRWKVSMSFSMNSADDHSLGRARRGPGLLGVLRWLDFALLLGILVLRYPHTAGLDCGRVPGLESVLLGARHSWAKLQYVAPTRSA